ncbi:MAG: hypothetical protein R6U46_05645 [Marinilabilia sp.]
MGKNILKVDPVAFRYDDPDFLESPDPFGEEDDFEWSDDDLAGYDFDPGAFEEAEEEFDPDLDDDLDPDWDHDPLDDEDT